MFDSILIAVTPGEHLFWAKALVACLLMTALYFLFKFGLRRFKFKQRDLKATGMNHRARRQWLAERKRRKKRKSSQRRF